MKKNTAGQKWVVFAFNRNTNVPLTGDANNITAGIRIDCGAANSVDDTNPTELSHGYYYFDISQAETNGNMLLLDPVSSTANIQVIGVPGAVPTVQTNSTSGYPQVDVAAKAGGKYKVANATGNWSTAGTWEDGSEPAAGDNIIVRDGVTLTTDVGAAITDLGQFGTLELQGNGQLMIGVTTNVLPFGWIAQTVNSGKSVTLNYGHIRANNGTVNGNYGRIDYQNGSVVVNSYGGSIGINWNWRTIGTNYLGGIVEVNAGTITTNSNGGLVNRNTGTITTQDAGGICHNYGGTIGTDNGVTNEYQTGDVYAQLPSNFSATVISVAGIVDVSMTHILGHLLAQTGTQIADNFQTFFDVGTQTFTSGTALADFKATGFNIVVPPSVVEFEARTLVTAEYATLAGQSTIAGYTDTLETLGATIAGYTDSLETATAALQGTANSIFTDTGTTLHQFVDEVESLLKNVTYGLAALKTALDLVPQIAAGGIATVVECKVGGVPVDGVEVWLTTDEAGANVVHGTIVSDAFGLANFGVIDSGTYFVWRQIAGMDFSNPQSITVS